MDKRTFTADGTRYIADAYGGRVTVERLEPKHAEIYPHLRAADHDEVEACSPIDPMLQIGFCIAESRPGYAIVKDGNPVVIFGVTGNMGGTGSPWLLATDEIMRYRVTFYRVSKGFIDEMKSLYDVLENWVHRDNALSIRWLKWAGFAFDEPKGAFMRFHWKKGDEGDVHSRTDDSKRTGKSVSGVHTAAGGERAGGSGGAERPDSVATGA